MARPGRKRPVVKKVLSPSGLTVHDIKRAAGMLVRPGYCICLSYGDREFICQHSDRVLTPVPEPWWFEAAHGAHVEPRDEGFDKNLLSDDELLLYNDGRIADGQVAFYDLNEERIVLTCDIKDLLTERLRPEDRPPLDRSGSVYQYDESVGF